MWCFSFGFKIYDISVGGICGGLVIVVFDIIGTEVMIVENIEGI